MTIICTGATVDSTVGHNDHVMAYAAGFLKLGHRVFFMEHVGSRKCIDLLGQQVPFEKWIGRTRFENLMKSYGIWPRCCLIYKKGKATYGMPYDEAVKMAKACDLLVTRSGIMKAPEILEYPQSRVYFDGNPGDTQVFLEQSGGDYHLLDRYDYLFTMGLNLGMAACPIPTGGRKWHPSVRPVVLPKWPPFLGPGHKRFTTISTWKGRDTHQWQGRHSGEKADNWLRFIDLPKRTGQKLEIALRVRSVRNLSDSEKFIQSGWRLTDPRKLCSLEDYRNYIGRSRGEFSVAHNIYVESSSGWFSDRSALYLASGKPVLVQSTGIESHLPTGKGLLTFSTMEEAVAGIEEINRDYPAHCRSAREIAEAYFDSDKVLTKILERIDGSSSG